MKPRRLEDAIDTTGEVNLRFIRLLLAFIVGLFLLRNVPWHLDNYDQAKQAFTSAEMLWDGAWGYQHTPSGKIATKPPLQGWISAGLWAVLGPDAREIALRLPPFACALFLLFLLRKWGAELYGTRTGAVLAVGAFALNAFVPRLATLVRNDMLLGTFIFLVGIMILRMVADKKAWSPRDQWIVAGALLASTMAKGPIAYAFLLPGVILHSIMTRRWRLRNDAWCGWWPWIVPLIPFIIWVWLGCMFQPEFYEQVVQREFLGRFQTGESAPHESHWVLFYVMDLVYKWLPWTVLFGALLARRDVRDAFRADPALLWLACWAAGGLLFMSLVPSKRFDRIFPVILPMCLMLPRMARHVSLRRWGHWSVAEVTVCACAIGFVFTGLYAFVKVTGGLATNQLALARFGDTVKREVHPAGSEKPAYAIVAGDDEGLLLYTRSTRFTKEKKALEKWESGELQFLVLPESVFEKAFPSGTSAQILARAPKVKGKSNGYVFLKKTSSAPAPPSLEAPK